jgi:acetoin utilization deacetylase AcuC-like enzyme
MNKTSTGFLWDERCMWHDTGLSFGPVEGSQWIEPGASLENAEGKRRIKNLLDASGLSASLVQIACQSATEEDILRIHSADYLSQVQKISDNGGGNIAKKLGITRIGSNGIDIALLAAGGAISAVRAVLDGVVDNAYALIRPPGHHAEPEEAMGFCIFANAALAGKYALDIGGLDRIAFVDWDVHHGNGTQASFWQDSRALTISLHQDNCYPPGSGRVDQIGEGAGTGTTLNIPLPPGSDETVYLAAFDRVVAPALERFKPQLIIVPCGFDAGFHDPLGRMMLTSHSFRRLTKRIMTSAKKLCRGKLVMTHEGGYSPHSVPFHCLAVIEQLSSIKTEVTDPFSPTLTEENIKPLLHHQELALAKAEDVLHQLKRIE